MHCNAALSILGNWYMKHAFLPHAGETWLCQTNGPRVIPLALAPGTPSAIRKFSSDGTEFGFLDHMGKRVAHCRVLETAPWFEYILPPTHLPKSSSATDIVIQQGRLIAVDRQVKPPRTWMYPAVPGVQALPSRGLPRSRFVPAMTVLHATGGVHMYALHSSRPTPDGVLHYISLRQQHDDIEIYVWSGSTCPEIKKLISSVVWDAWESMQLLDPEDVPLQYQIDTTLKLWSQQMKQFHNGLGPMLQTVQDMAFCSNYLVLALGESGMCFANCTSHETIHTPFEHYSMQQLVNVQSLQTQPGSSNGFYAIGLDARGAIAYEWVAMP